MDDIDTNEREASRCLSVLDHEAPVEALQWIQSTARNVRMWLVSAGGCDLKVWNPTSGASVYTLRAFHRKTITSLLVMPRKYFVDNTVQSRLITGGLDGLLRVYSWDKETGSLKYLHGVNMNREGNPVSITALAGSTQGDKIAIGTTSGQVVVRQMGQQIQSQKRTREPMAGTYSFFRRGMNADPDAGDHVVEVAKKRKRLAPFDVAMRQFRYSDALDAALATQQPHTVLAVLEELGKRHALVNAISNRDEDTLSPLLEFVVKCACRPKFSGILLHVASKLLDIYGEAAVGSDKTLGSLSKLKQQIHKEFQTQKKLLRLSGRIDAVITKAQL